MSRKGDCWDNAVAESLADLGAADAAVVDYIVDFYNKSRKHRTLGQVSPTTFETNWTQSQQMRVAA